MEKHLNISFCVFIYLVIIFNDLSEVEAAAFPCDQPILEGKCTNYVKRYGYDGIHCSMFMYGGCGANNNHFETIETCRSICEPNYKPIMNAEPDVAAEKPALRSQRTQEIRLVNWPVALEPKRDYYVGHDNLE